MNFSRKHQYDYSNMIKTFESFREYFTALRSLQVGDKIGYDENNNLYIDRSGYRQGIIRWYYKQSRTGAIDKLKSKIDEYILFIRFIDNVYGETIDENHRSLVRSIIKNITILHNTITNALFFLSKTYKSDKKIHETIIMIKDSLTFYNNFIRELL